MRYENGGLIAAQLVEAAEDILLGDGVKRRCGLIQDQNVGIAVKGTRDRQLLSLTAR